MTNDKDNFDFELPEVETSSPTVKIHVAPGDSSCTSCEG